MTRWAKDISVCFCPFSKYILQIARFTQRKLNNRGRASSWIFTPASEGKLAYVNWQLKRRLWLKKCDRCIIVHILLPLLRPGTQDVKKHIARAAQHPAQWRLSLDSAGWSGRQHALWSLKGYNRGTCSPQDTDSVSKQRNTFTELNFLSSC